jgi:multidrug resistance efflux pump
MILCVLVILTFPHHIPRDQQIGFDKSILSLWRRQLSLGNVSLGIVGKLKWRQLAGLGMLVLTGSSFAAIITRRSAAEAYITGDIIHVRSPMDGLVVSQPLATGESFRAGQVLVAVSATRADEARHESARLALVRIQDELAATHAHLDDLMHANIIRLRNELDASKKDLRDVSGMVQRYTLQEGRYRHLVRLGALDPEALAGSQALRNSFIQRSENQQRLVFNLSKELAEAVEMRRSGITQLPSPSRRLEILELEIVALNRKVKELQAKKVEAQRRFAISLRHRNFAYRSPFAGVVLSNSTAKQSQAGKNEVLMSIFNCDRLKVEALFDASRIADRKPGDDVLITSRSDGKSFPGRITSMRGVKSLQSLKGPDAATFNLTNDDRLRVQISAPNALRNRECRVGERVDVRL